MRPRYSDEQLSAIFDRTGGRCHLCHSPLAWKNYGLCGASGAWEVDHYRPVSKGGSHRARNLYAACISCNRSRGAMHAPAFRRLMGVTEGKAPVRKADAPVWAWLLGAAGLLVLLQQARKPASSVVDLSEAGVRPSAFPRAPTPLS